MARSYKFKIIKDRNDKYYKRLSNKKIRKYKMIINGGFFKKIENQYNISDYKFIIYNIKDNPQAHENKHLKNLLKKERKKKEKKNEKKRTKEKKERKKEPKKEIKK